MRDTLFPFWYEIVSVAWYAGLLLAQITNPGAKGGLAWVKPLIVSLGVIVVIVHISVSSRTQIFDFNFITTLQSFRPSLLMWSTAAS